MKCPSCGGTATKEKPEDQFQCESCAWKLETVAATAAQQSYSEFDPL
jgi:hypothetical protein